MVSKGKVNHAPQESIGGCSSPSPRLWARTWRTTMSDAWPVQRRLPSQLQGITVRWLVPNYTAWWQRHVCVINLPGVALDSGRPGFEPSTCWSQVQRPNHSATESHTTVTAEKYPLKQNLKKNVPVSLTCYLCRRINLILAHVVSALLCLLYGTHFLQTFVDVHFMALLSVSYDG